MKLNGYTYHGRSTEPDFLARLFNLKAIKSRDDRYSNAYDDIYQHMVNNNDWPEDWIYTDTRINLLYADDDLYLRFLAATMHPAIRNEQTETVEFLRDIYNKHLAVDGFEMVQTSEISGRPVFSGRARTIGGVGEAKRKVDIKRYLNTEYVASKINLMHDSIDKDTDLALGTAKELLETTCKSILRQKGVEINKDWTLPQLLKVTVESLDFKPKHTDDPAKAEKAIKQILGGVSSIIHGVTELRNSYGTGHGKEADFKGLEAKYAKLFVGVVSEVAVLFLATNGEAAELVETVDNSESDLPF